MRLMKIMYILIFIVVLVCAGTIYVYIGTYLLPIAPKWITQLPPNPPCPQIKHGEFSFKLEYELKDERKTIEDILICNFDGFDVNALGGPKRRTWKEQYKNEQNNELYAFRIEDPNYNGYKYVEPKYNQIVLQNIDQYKIVFSTASAEYFLGEPEYKGTPEMPYIQVYDTSIGYYKDPEQSKEFLDELNFKVIEWYCDPPIKNTFK